MSAVISRHRGTRSLPLLAAVALAALVGSCGDDGSAAGDSDTTTSTMSAGPTSSAPTTTATTAVAQPGESCSAADLPSEPPEDASLPVPVAEMRRSIVAAATGCDFDRLAELAQTGTFSYSFGGGTDPAGFWRRAEADSDPLAALVQFLNGPSATRPAGEVTHYVWPRAYAYESWDAVPADARQELRSVYSAEDLERFDRFRGYTGYRVGIDAGGDWLFFIAGD